MLVILLIVRKSHVTLRRKNTEISYRDELFQKLSMNVDDVFLMLDAKTSKVDYVSPNIERLLGIPWKEVRQDVFVLDKLHPKNAPEHGKNFLEGLLSGEEREWDFEYEHLETKERRWFHNIAMCSEVEGRTKYILVMSDRTADKQVNQALSDAVAAAETANRAKSTFLSNMSHDIRTPMNAIIGFTSLAATHIENKEQVLDYLKKISTSSQHLLSLINDVLDMSRIESGKVKIEEKAVHLPDLVHDIRSIIQPNISSKRLSLFIDTMDVVDEDIITDPLRLNQVLLNILSNAIKFTPTGGMVSIRIAQKPGAPKGCGNYEFRKLELAVRHEAAANRAKREFLFNMSHDIRTPMNAIIGFTALAQTHIDDRDQVEDYLKKISVSSQHLLSLINDVLDMSRIENGKVTLETKPVHLPELVEDIGDAIQVGADKKHISFTVDTAGMKNEDVIADPLRLEQILINVLANAVKFTPDGGQISLRIVQKDTASADYADFEFHIKDNGIGMSEEFQKHIFEQFARERTSTVSKIQGTGLGLAITKSLVDMMGGRITVESEPGRGSEFTISLRFPVGEAKAGQMIPVSKASDFTGKKLLVVEDNELNLEIASTLLEEAGFEVDTAGNGKIAVEKVEAASAGRYDLILMDVQMPEMDGYEATRRIRALPDKKKAAIPIVAMTANAFEEDQKNALNVGMNGHIAKPLDIQKLFQVLSELLK